MFPDLIGELGKKKVYEFAELCDKNGQRKMYKQVEPLIEVVRNQIEKIQIAYSTVEEQKLYSEAVVREAVGCLMRAVTQIKKPE